MENSELKSNDAVADLRERIASKQALREFHPYWSTHRIVPDEPLWHVMVRDLSQEKWIGFHSPARDLDEAISEASDYWEIANDAEVSVHPTIPRSESYTRADRTLVGLLLAVPVDHPDATAMYKQIRDAMTELAEAKRTGSFSAQ